jgi:hypothetical protein
VPQPTYEYITKLWRQQAEVLENYENANIHNIEQGEARHRKYKRLKLGDYTAVVVEAAKDRA